MGLDMDDRAVDLSLFQTAQHDESQRETLSFTCVSVALPVIHGKLVQVSCQ